MIHEKFLCPKLYNVSLPDGEDLLALSPIEMLNNLQYQETDRLIGDITSDNLHREQAEANSNADLLPNVSCKTTPNNLLKCCVNSSSANTSPLDQNNMNQSFSCKASSVKKVQQSETFSDDDFFNDSLIKSTQAIEEALFDKRNNKFFSPANYEAVLSKVGLRSDNLETMENSLLQSRNTSGKNSHSINEPISNGISVNIKRSSEPLIKPEVSEAPASLTFRHSLQSDSVRRSHTSKDKIVFDTKTMSEISSSQLRCPACYENTKTKGLRLLFVDSQKCTCSANQAKNTCIDISVCAQSMSKIAYESTTNKYMYKEGLSGSANRTPVHQAVEVASENILIDSVPPASKVDQNVDCVPGKKLLYINVNCVVGVRSLLKVSERNKKERSRQEGLRERYEVSRGA